MQHLIFDTSALLNFGHRDKLTSLLSRFARRYRLLTTAEVDAELTDPDRRPYYDKLLHDHFKKPPLEHVTIDLRTLAHLHQILGPGEVSVILMAGSLPGIAVLDDRVARRQAAQLGITLTGTLGLVRDAVTLGWLDAHRAMARITELRRGGFLIPAPIEDQTLDEYLRQFSDA